MATLLSAIMTPINDVRMKNNMSILFLALALINISCTSEVHYLDNNFPDLTPKKYAQGIINIEDRFQQSMTMSPDGREHLFVLSESEIWRYRTIIRVKSTGMNEIIVDTPQFVKNFKYERAPVSFIGDPMISPDNKTLYFIADYPPDYFYSVRTSTGDWSEPVKMDSISTEVGDWYVSVSRNNTLYSASGNGRIFKFPPNNDGEYTERILVKGTFNEEDAGDPYISPNEDYIIFPSLRDGGYGQGDLYVAFKDKDGNWSDAYNLGSEINTKDFEGGPYISPDEKYLFFTRRDSWRNAQYSYIYWVSMAVVENIINEYKLKP